MPDTLVPNTNSTSTYFPAQTYDAKTDSPVLPLPMNRLLGRSFSPECRLFDADVRSPISFKMFSFMDSNGGRLVPFVCPTQHLEWTDVE